ncbi:Methionine synthase [Auxenochlorella protothecoides]|uniref:Methionine synthase n=1 Tax=Auxenochlorella protothecoides TaxID=3075 RepID=A0A087SUF5_AUXPR|nr:Methionine synthase [Auxenochlorella protothecoides]KFM29359.1 Methionine synthase [Auxenochlorella protothecoides]
MASGTADSVLLLDGGMGHLLKSQDIARFAPDLPVERQFAAAALANAAAPDLIVGLHEVYIAAGCHVITSNTFGCTSWSLSRAGAAERTAELAAAGAMLARRAADAAPRPVVVADRSHAQLEEYATLAHAMAPAVDVLLCETMSSADEAAVAASAAAATGKPVWISWTLQDASDGEPRLRSGESLQAAWDRVKDIPCLQAILINCSSPGTVGAAVPCLRRLAPAGVRVGGYANGFRQTTGEWLEGRGKADINDAGDYDEVGDLLPGAYAAHAASWVRAGAGIVGGCCGVGPAHIESVSALLQREGGALEYNSCSAERRVPPP